MPKTPAQQLLDYLIPRGEMPYETFENMVKFSQRGEIPFDPQKAARDLNREGKITIIRDENKKPLRIILV